jgi:hypothetical protein
MAKKTNLKKKTPQQTRSKLREDCVYKWGLIVRNRDKHLCQWHLDRGEQVYGNQPHHIIAQAQGNVARFTVDNGITLCLYCHKWGINKDPVGFSDFVKLWLKKGGKDYYEMKERFLQTQKLSEKDYRQIKDNFEWVLKEMEGR